MKIAFIVNDIATEIHSYTTINLAFKATEMGHEAYLAGVGELMYLSNGHMGADAFKVEEGSKIYQRNAKRHSGILREDEDWPY